MDLLVHVTVTMALAILLAAAFGDKSDPVTKTKISFSKSKSLKAHGLSQKRLIDKFWGWLYLLGKYADIRLLIIGALLPDIIDKPLGDYILRNVFNNGRIYAHTLLF